ncbi:MAG: YbaN family protein [Rhodospirillaceae bacterium]|nr:YbaN family protein [Rhodospirillaceae bacterium]
MTEAHTPREMPPPPLAETPRWLSPFYVVLGLVSTGTGIVGMFVPVLPTTVFLIVGLWAFSKSSRRLQVWLWTHRTFGPTLQAWHLHRVIPVKIKFIAISVMILSLLVIVYEAKSWIMPTISAAVVLPVALWIATRRSYPPAPSGAHQAS